jgi:hypothetical protein
VTDLEALRVRVIVCIVAIWFASLPLCPHALAQTKLNARYSISLLGLTVGQGTWDVEINGDEYSEKARSRISGMATTLINGEASASTLGTLQKDRALPALFEADVKTDVEIDKIRMELDAAGVTDLVVDPPFLPARKERVPVTEAHRKGVLDPLSAGLVIVAGSDDLLKPQSCPGRIPVFDGRRRFDVDLNFMRVETVKAEGGYQGPGIVCSARLVPIAGHRVGGATLQLLVKLNAVEVTLVPLAGTRILVPFKASIPTLVGTVAIAADRFTVSGPIKPPAGAGSR